MIEGGVHAGREIQEQFSFNRSVLPLSSEKKLPIAAGYPERCPVPLASRLWEREYPGYQPTFYEAARVLEMDRTKVVGGWADPATVTREEFQRQLASGELLSYEGRVRLDPENGRPLNPAGRTGICGRGLLGKWGPNQAADALLTRVNPHHGMLEVLLIQRGNGEWAIPGGMLDSGEDALTAARRELLEEAGVDLQEADGKMVYQGFGGGPRTTDNAWIETTLYHFHLDAQHPAALCEPAANNEVQGARWVIVSDRLASSLYSNHGEMLSMALSQMRVGADVPEESVQEQLDQIPHAVTLTSFADLHGRVGIMGGTFDPIQAGHVYAARAAMKKHKLDAVVFIPAVQNPVKGHEPGALGRERFEMIAGAISADRRLFVSPFELRKGGVSYTIDTVREIRQQLPEHSSLFFIVGSDCPPQFPRWREFDQLASLVTFIPVERSVDQRVSALELAPLLGEELAKQLESSVVEALGPDISSTQVRGAIRNGEDASLFIPPAVSSYIDRHMLYRGEAAAGN